MDRNFLLAFALSFLVIALWMSAQPQRPQPGDIPPDRVAEAPAPGTQRGAAPTAETPAPGTPIPDWQPIGEGSREPFESTTPTAPAPRPADAREIVVSLERADAAVSTYGATLVRWDLRDYHDAGDPGHPPVSMVTPAPFLPGALATPLKELGVGDWSTVPFQVEEEGRHHVVLSATREGVTVRKHYVFEPSSYGFTLRIEIENGTSRTLEPNFEVMWPAVQLDTNDYRDFSLVGLQNDEVEILNIAGQPGAAGCNSPFGGGGDEKPLKGGVHWAGAQTRYFLAAVIPEVASVTWARFLPIEEGRIAVATVAQEKVDLRPGASHTQQYRLYVGPKDLEILSSGPEGAAQLDRAVALGWSWIAPLTKFFGWLLETLYAYIPNYGWVIILITVLVRLVTAPLLGRQMRSMKKMSTQMQALKPQLDAIKEKYGDDRQRMSEETMKAYREAGVNPLGMLGGCLPLFLQFPVFIGLFYALQGSISLRQAPFMGWIDDLSVPEALFVIPGLEIPFRVLPLVMGASMFLQQKFTPQTSMDPAQQRMMMTVMPVMFTVLFYQFPSGLVLYWMVSNFLAIAHQLWINRTSDA